jgi:hypothetical protein
MSLTIFSTRRPDGSSNRRCVPDLCDALVAAHPQVEGWVLETFLAHMSGSLCWVSSSSDLMVCVTPGWEGVHGMMAVQAQTRDGDNVCDGPFDHDLTVPVPLTVESYLAAVLPLLRAALEHTTKRTRKA